MAPLTALSALGLAGLEAAVFFGVPVPPSAQMLLAAFFTVYMGCRNGVALGGAEEAVQVRRGKELFAFGGRSRRIPPWLPGREGGGAGRGLDGKHSGMPDSARHHARWTA